MNLVGGSAILRIFIYKVTVTPHYVLITIKKKYVWHTFCDSSYIYFVPIYPRLACHIMAQSQALISGTK